MDDYGELAALRAGLGTLWSPFETALRKLREGLYGEEELPATLSMKTRPRPVVLPSAPPAAPSAAAAEVLDPPIEITGAGPEYLPRAVEQDGRITLTDRPEAGMPGGLPQLPRETIGGRSMTSGAIETATTRPGTRGAYTPSAPPLAPDISEEELSRANPILAQQWLENKQNWAAGQIPEAQLNKLAAEAGLMGAQGGLAEAQAGRLQQTPLEERLRNSYEPAAQFYYNSPEHQVLIDQIAVDLIRADVQAGHLKPPPGGIERNPQLREAYRWRAALAYAMQTDPSLQYRSMQFGMQPYLGGM